MTAPSLPDFTAYGIGPGPGSRVKKESMDLEVERDKVPGIAREHMRRPLPANSHAFVSNPNVLAADAGRSVSVIDPDCPIM